MLQTAPTIIWVAFKHHYACLGMQQQVLEILPFHALIGKKLCGHYAPMSAGLSCTVGLRGVVKISVDAQLAKLFPGLLNSHERFQ
mmetsp:Transcript_55763/g.120513  ORF Transcript_55763/g.120513 Transcript_55763/m.120513 type:complete len:85 (+) Transcript_55763:342-596(+)